MGQFEEKLKELKATTRLLDNPDVDIEDAIRLYIKGKALLAECEQILKDTEKRVKEVEEKVEHENAAGRPADSSR